jgi:hypothetical protein
MPASCVRGVVTHRPERTCVRVAAHRPHPVEPARSTVSDGWATPNPEEVDVRPDLGEGGMSTGVGLDPEALVSKAEWWEARLGGEAPAARGSHSLDLH